MWPLNRQRNEIKQSCIVKDGIETNQISAKNTIVTLSNTTVAHFGSLALFSFFFFTIQGEKDSEKQRQIIISLEPINVRKHFTTILFLPDLH